MLFIIMYIFLMSGTYLYLSIQILILLLACFALFWPLAMAISRLNSSQGGEKFLTLTLHPTVTLKKCRVSWYTACPASLSSLRSAARQWQQARNKINSGDGESRHRGTMLRNKRQMCLSHISQHLVNAKREISGHTFYHAQAHDIISGHSSNHAQTWHYINPLI